MQHRIHIDGTSWSVEPETIATHYANTRIKEHEKKHNLKPGDYDWINLFKDYWYRMILSRATQRRWLYSSMSFRDLDAVPDYEFHEIYFNMEKRQVQMQWRKNK